MTDTDAILQDFDADEENLYFNFTGDGDEFWRALDFLKEDIPVNERSWSDDDELWTVKRSPDNKLVLRRIFANGECCILRAT